MHQTLHKTGTKEKNLQRGHRVLSIFISMIMMLSLAYLAMPSMKAKADEFDYSTLIPKSGDALTSMQVTFNGIKWYVVGYGESGIPTPAGRVTLLTAECVGACAFNEDANFDDFEGSTIQEFLSVSYYTSAGFSNVEDAIVNGELGKLYLLTKAEADAIKKININVLKCHQATGSSDNYWWLNEPGTNPSTKMTIDGDTGNVWDLGEMVSVPQGVRPALQLDLEAVNYDSANREFVYAPEKKALLVAKRSACDELDTLLASKNEDDYEADDWAALNKAITDGKAAIDASTTTDEVDTAKKAAVDAVEAIGTREAKALNAAKQAAKDELDALLAKMNQADYSAEDWAALTKAIEDAKAAIDAAASVDEITTARNTAVASVTAIDESAKKQPVGYNTSIKVKQKSGKLIVSWDKVSNVKKVKVYAGYLGKKNSVKLIKTIGGNKVAIKKIKGQKIDQTRSFQIYLVGYDSSGKKIGKSMPAYVAGKDSQDYTNAKSIKLSKSKLTVAIGKKTKIAAKIKLENKDKKLLPVKKVKKLRYKSTIPGVATVDKKGNIKGVSTGTCYIYVYARNGLAKKVKVTVKE